MRILVTYTFDAKIGNFAKDSEIVRKRIPFTNKGNFRLKLLKEECFLF